MKRYYSANLKGHEYEESLRSVVYRLLQLPDRAVSVDILRHIKGVPDYRYVVIAKVYRSGEARSTTAATDSECTVMERAVKEYRRSEYNLARFHLAAIKFVNGRKQMERIYGKTSSTVAKIKVEE